MSNPFSVLKNAIKKKSIENGIWLYLLQFFNTIVPLLTLPYVTRVLGADGYGFFSIALNILGYLQVLVEYGFAMSATREVAVGKEANLNKIFSEVVYARMLLMIVSVAIAGTYMLVVGGRDSNICLILLLLCLPGYCLQMNWLFQGKEEMKYISIINIVSRSLSVIGTFIFVRTTNDLNLYCILYAISPLLSGIIGFIIAKYKYNLHFIHINRELVSNSLKKGWYVFTTQLGAKVFGAIGITFLGVFALPQIVGIYSAIQKIPNILLLAWLPIAQVLYPIASKHMCNGFEDGYAFVKRVRIKILPAFIFVALLISIFAKQVVGMAFGKEYIDYYYLLFPLLGWMLVSINNNFLGVQVLLASGHDKEYSRSFYVGVVATIVTNLVLIFFWKEIGAAFAPFISECILGIVLLLNVRNLRA